MKHLLLAVLLLWEYGGGLLPDGYRIYYGQQPGVYQTIDQGPNTWAELDLATGVWYFAVSALKNGEESSKTPEVIGEVKKIEPPTTVIITFK